MQLELQNHHFELLPERAIFWQEEKALILSDIHIGKGMHFRKAGIPIPKELFDDDLQKLATLIERFSPVMLIVVGDMFHSHHNNEVVMFDLWRVQYPHLPIHLVKGNHDILSAQKFKELEITVHRETFVLRGFNFSHEPCHDDGQFCFSGHIHPGIRLSGLGRQVIKLPCFHFTPNTCTLPAFSKFTGLALIEPQKEDKVFAIYDNKVEEI